MTQLARKSVKLRCIAVNALCIMHARGSGNFRSREEIANRKKYAIKVELRETHAIGLVSWAR